MFRAGVYRERHQLSDQNNPLEYSPTTPAASAIPTGAARARYQDPPPNLSCNAPCGSGGVPRPDSHGRPDEPLCAKQETTSLGPWAGGGEITHQDRQGGSLVVGNSSENGSRLWQAVAGLFSIDTYITSNASLYLPPLWLHFIDLGSSLSFLPFPTLTFFSPSAVLASSLFFHFTPRHHDAGLQSPFSCQP